MLLKQRERGVVLASAASVVKIRLAANALWSPPRRACKQRRHRHAGGLGRPVRRLAPLLPALGHRRTAQQAELLRRSGRALIDGASARLALPVDDAHVPDDVSATLTHQVAATYGVFVVATVGMREP